MRVLIEDQSRMGDVLMSTAAYVEIVRHFPNAELLTLPCSAEIGRRFFQLVHVSWDTVGRPDVAITLHVSRKTNWEMFKRRIPVRAGYYYNHGLLNIAKLCLNVRLWVPGQLFRDKYRVDEVCELFERLFGWKIERKMRI